MSSSAADGETPKPRGRFAAAKKALSYLREQRSKFVLRALVFVSVIALLWPFIAVVVPAGKVGVVFQPLLGGTSINRPLREGLNFILPWNKVTLYDTRVQVQQTEFEAVTKDGLHIMLGVVYRYRLHTSTVGRLHKSIGPEYVKVLLNPAINAIVRMEAARFKSEEIYGDGRRNLQDLIYRGVVDPDNHNLIEGGSDPHAKDELMIASAPSGSVGSRKAADYVPLVEIVDILITEVRLPESVRQAIERKEEQQQIQEEYTYRIEREKLESERKRIEAEGIRSFQQTVQAGISDTYLRWRGIEATLQLATSPNSKVVIIGSGRNGMPLILNTDDDHPAAVPAQPQTKPKPAKTRSKSTDIGGALRSGNQSDGGSLSEGPAPSGGSTRK